MKGDAFPRFLRRRIGLMAVGAMGFAAGRAQVVTPTGSIDWLNPAGWSTGHIPGGSETPQISAGTLTVTGAVSIGSVNLFGGSLTNSGSGNGALTITGTGSEWRGPPLNSAAGGTLSLIVGSSANLLLSTGSSHDFNASAITNAGTMTWTGGEIRGGNGSTLTNNGTFNDQDSPGYVLTNPSFNGTAGTFVFANAGTYNRTVTGTTPFNITFNNTGTVSVSGGGRLSLNGGGASSGAFNVSGSGSDLLINSSYTLSAGASLSGAVRQTAGTLTVNGSIPISGFSFEGGSLAGTQTFTGGALSWIGGDWDSPGTTTIASGATLTLTNGANHDFNQRAIVNNGNVTWVSGYLRGGNGATFTNAASATFTDQNAGSYTVHNPSFNGTAGTFVFANDGSYNRAVTGTTTLDTTFNNTGTVNISGGGRLTLNGGGTSSGAFNVSGSGSEIVISNSYTLASGATTSGPVRVTAGTFSATGTIPVSGFSFEGGSLQGTQTFSGGALAWIGGDWNAAATTTIAANATLTLGNGANHDFNQRAIVNNGIVTWNDGYLRGGNGSSFLNNGTFNDLNSQSYTVHNPGFNGTAGTFTFTNNGTYTRNATGTTFFDVGFDNYAAINVTQGTLEFRAGGTLSATGTINAASSANVIFDAGTFTIANGASLLGAGSFTLDGGTLVLPGTVTFTTFNQTAGVLSGTNTLKGGTFNWSGGDWNTSGTGLTTTLFAGTTLNLGNGVNHDFNQRGIINNGVVNWSSGYIRGGNGSTFLNNGTFNDQNSQSYTIHNPGFNGTAGTFTFTNNGTYTRDAVNSTTFFDVPFDNNGAITVVHGDLQFRAGGTLSNTGTITAQAGAHVYFPDSYTINNGASLNGAGQFLLTGGTLTLNGTIGVGNFSQTGGTLAGTNAISGSFTWSGGDWNALSPGPTTTITGGAALTLNNGANHDFNQRGVVNNGTVTWIDGYIRGGNGSTFVNNGTFTDQNSQGYTFSNPGFNGTAGTFTFTSNGTYTRNAGGTTYFDVPLLNNGTLNLQQGDIQLRANGTMGATSSVNVSAGAHFYFLSAYTLLDGAQFTGAGLINQTAGTLTIDGQLKASAFLWSGGNWNAANNSGLTTTVASGSILNLSDGNDGTRDFNGRTIDNQGTVNWSSGGLRSSNGGAFVNTGQFNDLNSSGYSINNPSLNGTAGTFTFTNNGTYTRHAGGTTYFDAPLLNNGTLNLEQGDIQLRAGGTMGATSVVNVSAGAHLYFTNNYTLLSGAQLTGPGLINQTAGTLTIDGQLKASAFLWSGGNWNAVNNSGLTTTIAAGSVLNLTDGTDTSRDFNGRTIDNLGTVNWSSGHLRSSNGGAFINDGTFNDLNSPGYSITNPSLNGTAGTFVFTNNGTYLRNVGGTTYFDTTFDNNGTLNLQQGDIQVRAGGTMGAASIVNVSAGAHLYFTNNYALNTGAQFLGAGLVNQIAGTLTVNGTLTAAAFLWSGGNWNAANNSGLTTTIAAGSVLNLTDGTDTTRDFNGRAIVNNGTVNWSSGHLRSSNGGTFVNNGQFNDLNSPGYSINNPSLNSSAGTFVFTNNGTYTRNVGGTTYLQTTFDNNGTLNLQQGDVRVEGGGTMSATGIVNAAPGAHLYFVNNYTLLSGSQFTGAGLVAQIGGTLTADGTLTASGFTWSGGNWNAVNSSGLTTTIAAGSVLNVSDATDTTRDFNGRTIANRGTFNWNSGYLRSSNGGAIINYGTFNDLNSPGYTINNPSLGGTAGTFDFTNNGTYNHAVGGTSFIQVPFINNNGLVSSSSGVLRFQSTFQQNAGTIAVANGGTIQFDHGLNLAAGFLVGTGIIAGNVSSSDRIFPGGEGATGTLGITGNLTLQSTSLLLFELGGTTPGAGYDSLNVGGTAALDGKLQLDVVNGFTAFFTPAQTFTLLSSSGLSGSFLNIPNGGRLVALDGASSFQVNYTATSITLSNFLAVPEPSTYALLVVGLGVLAGAARRRARR